MVIIETTVFTRQVVNLLPDKDYRSLQLTLANRPDTGDLIKGSGGLRKIRWAAVGQGKRGGARVIYYWAVPQDQILMLFMYPKSERADLTVSQIRVLRKIIEEEYP
jgi:hypothetical protein